MTTPKLLLADDSVTIRKVVELAFSDESVEVFVVADGEAAMLKFVEVQPDIVLVDVEMPGPNGYQICEMIKQDEATRHIPVLLLVGSFEPFDQDEAERVEADGFLTKPFHSVRDLVARVGDLLGGETAEPAPIITPETADIEELYNSSFAETSPIDEYDTDEDPFLEASVESVSTPDEFEAEVDDELIEEVRLSEPVSENNYTETFHSAETIATTKDFDWSPSAKIVDEVPAESVSIGFEPRFAFADTEPNEEIPELAETGNGFVRVDDDVAEESAELSAGISEETINRIAQRVVERLSDHVIREIAQEAVPRIAEKLIREALEEEDK